jgi:hypothetical protein
MGHSPGFPTLPPSSVEGGKGVNFSARPFFEEAIERGDDMRGIWAAKEHYCCCVCSNCWGENNTHNKGSVLYLNSSVRTQLN